MSSPRKEFDHTLYTITRDTRSEDRSSKFNALQETLVKIKNREKLKKQANTESKDDSDVPHLSVAKRKILETLIAYAKANLVNRVLTTTNPVRINTYNNILASTDKPDLLFLDQVRLELEAIEDPTSQLNKSLSATLKECNDGGRYQHVNDIRCIALGLIMTMAAADSRVGLFLLFYFMALETVLPQNYRPSEAITELRIQQGHRAFRALEFQDANQRLLIGDGIDDPVSRSAQLARRSLSTLFTKMIQHGEQKIERLEANTSGAPRIEDITDEKQPKLK
jgi:hypothetical protein